MHKINLDHYLLHYTITYQKGRRTIRLKVIASDYLEIIAPSRYPKAAIEKMLMDKQSWIIGQIRTLAATASNPVNKSLTPGSQILYLGIPRTITVSHPACSQPDTSESSLSVILLENQLQVRLQTDAALSPILYDWYLERATALLTDKTASWAERIGVQPNKICLRDQKTRWGSCSSRGTISYNWRVVMAPPEVIDYLIVHELCHMRIPNHSQSYWRLVSQFVSNFSECRRWLRDNGPLLSGIF